MDSVAYIYSDIYNLNNKYYSYYGGRRLSYIMITNKYGSKKRQQDNRK